MYVSIDIETTGLDPETCQVLEIAMVADVRTLSVRDCPVFHEIIKPKGLVVGEPKALAMNADLLRRIAWAGERWDIKLERLERWLSINLPDSKDWNLLGKNVGSFDWQFVKRLPGWPVHDFSHRFMDVGSLYATKEGMMSQASLVPQIAQEAAIPGKEHEALFDARVSLALARKKWGVTI